MEKRKIGEVNSKSSVNIHDLRKQKQTNGCISIYSLKNICPKWYTIREHFITRISRNEAEKSLVAKIKNKILLPTIRIL